MGYSSRMVKILRTAEFDNWLDRLKDRLAKSSVQARIDRLAKGNAGDVKPVGEGVSEMRIHVGAGYWVYFTRVGTTIVLLLCGGDKSSQNRNIERALEMAPILKE
jgi:putative addiction module killer protein